MTQRVKFPFIWTTLVVLMQSPHNRHASESVCDSWALPEAYPSPSKYFISESQGPHSPGNVLRLYLDSLSHLTLVRAQWEALSLLPSSRFAKEETEEWSGEMMFPRLFSLSIAGLKPEQSASSAYCLKSVHGFRPVLGRASGEGRLGRAQVSSTTPALGRRLCTWLDKPSGHTGSVSHP